MRGTAKDSRTIRTFNNRAKTSGNARSANHERFTSQSTKRLTTMKPNVLLRTIFACVTAITLHGQTDWPSYGHDPGGMRFSPLQQINTGNVSKLVRAWTYDISEQSSRKRPGEATPLVVGDVMYLTTSYGRVVALEPETGKEIWKFETGEKGVPS